MAAVSFTPRTGREVLSWHAGAADIALATRFLSGAFPIVLSGTGGAETARRLRLQGYTGQLLVDPAQYEAQADADEARLFAAPIDWADLQRRGQVTSLLTPGVYVPPGDAGALEAALVGQATWAEREGGATIQLALHWQWLADSGDRLLDLFSGAGPIALLLCDSNDPLSKAGTVEALARIASACPNVALHRSDLGSLGYIAHGGWYAAAGIRSGLRHVVPTGKRAGGPPADRSPSVFVPQLLAWLKGSKLSGLGASDTEGRFVCIDSCCGGRPLRRFWDPASAADAVEHNRVTFERVALALLGEDMAARSSLFKRMCIEAEVLAAEWSGALKWDLSHLQRAGWANL